MPHSKYTYPSKPRLFFNYLLSLIGFDRFAVNSSSSISISSTSTSSTIHYPYDGPPHSSASSTCSFLTGSTLFVDHDEKEAFDKPAGFEGGWSVLTWIRSLTRPSLCQVQWESMKRLAQEKEARRDLWMICGHAQQLTHSLDDVRPNEQFARAGEIAQDLEQLVRLCVHVLQQNPLGIVVGLMLIVQQSLRAPAEVRQHLFYQTKLGRLVVLEMMNAFKYHHQHQPPHSDVLAVLRFFVEQQEGPDKTKTWVQVLEQLCIKLSRYDATWEFREDYSRVVALAESYSVATGYI